MKEPTHTKIFILLVSIACIVPSCTDTSAKVYDQVVNFWQNPDQIAAGVAPAYTGLRNFGPGFFNGPYELNELTTDEIIVPNRITDWGDDATWEHLWKHTWDPSTNIIEAAWQTIYSGIARINSIIEVVGSISPKPDHQAAILAELKTVRAYYYFQAMDLFGNVPIVENNHVPLSSLVNKSRIEVFNYVENELKANFTDLTDEVSPNTYGRTTKWFTKALLAKLYLNAEVYTGTARWADCLAECDSILASNNYSLENNFFDNFKIENQNSTEFIFAIPYDFKAGMGDFAIQLLTLHYNSGFTFGLQNGGANGYCSTQDYLNNFDPKDIRRKMFLVGQQYTGSTQYVDPVPDSSRRQYDNLGNLLIFDPDFTTFEIQQPKTQGAGARCAKWEFNKDTWGDMSNDLAVFRLADIILMKAEAQYRLGNSSEALQTINNQYGSVSIRSRANMPDFTSAELNADGILAERARELSWEGWRRNDMIRLGHYTDARVPEKAKSENFRKLFPIPQNEMHKNQYLTQNPGY